MAKLRDDDRATFLVHDELKSPRTVYNRVNCGGNALFDQGQRIPLRKPPTNPRSLLVKLEDKIPKLVSVLKMSRSRIRSASAGRDRRSDLQARYWGLLFENLRRAVDEIYLTCESDESVEECKEAIMILESCTKDFRNLIEWLRLKWNYEQTPAPNRPTSLAWEVRKSSPAKPSCAAIMGQLQKTPVGIARRILNFDDEHTVINAAMPLGVIEGKASIAAAEFSTRRVATINEGVESLLISKQPPCVAAISVRKPSGRMTPEIRPTKPVEPTAKSATVAVTKPKPWKVGKASKNAVNSEVQSQQTQSSAQKVVTKVLATQQQQTWAQRIQNMPKFDLSQPQSKSKLNGPKPEPHKPLRQPATPGTAAPTAKPVQSPAVAVKTVDPNDGWETVRGRTRSRASPMKSVTPTLTRASTVIYTSRSEASKQSKTLQQCKRLPGLTKPIAAQSLPSLCDRSEEPIAVVEPAVAVDVAPPARASPSPVETSDEDKDETDEAVAKVEAEEEAEMARQEEALTAEEESLAAEMRETERSDNEADELWDDPINVTPASTPEGIPLDQPTERAVVERDLLEEKYHVLLQNCSWADQMDLLDQLEEVAAIDSGARQPGRALQVHEKLSSPSRRRMAEPCQAFEQHEAKQRRAREHRAALQEERARKRRELTKRMDEVREAKSRLVVQKKLLLERKMKRAEEKRMKHLDDIRKKAHDEEEKKKEIAFINTIEAQNKRHDFITHIQTQEERIQVLQEERLRKQEERKLAKEAAVEVRKKALEAERQAKMAQLQEKRRQREERIDREHQEKEKERLELAREKQRDREERLSALQAAHQASQSELQRKIRQKQEESARRHEENMEQIRQKALELSILRFSSAGGEDEEGETAPRATHYEPARHCNLCNVAIDSELVLMSHLRGRKHIEALKSHYGGKEPSRQESESSNLKFIVDAVATPEESANGVAVVVENDTEKRAKALKKRAKKMKTKVLQQNTTESSLPPCEGSNRHRMARVLQDLERDPTGHDRHWAELVRLLDKGASNDQLVFGVQRGVGVVAGILSDDQGRGAMSNRVILAALNALRLACRSHLAVSTLVSNSRAAPLLLSFLGQRLEALQSSGNQVQASDSVITTGLNAWVTVVETLVANPDSVLSNQELASRLMNLISFAVSLRLVDLLASHIGGVRGPIEQSSPFYELVVAALKFLTSLINLLKLCQKPAKKRKSLPDTTQLVEAFQITELASVVNALYGLLLHQGVPSGGNGRPASPARQLEEPTALFTITALQLLHRLALLDLGVFQGIVGAEGVSLEFRHIASFLLWYGVNAPASPSNQLILNLTIISTGYFATGHLDNQMMLSHGHMPSVLQQLCRLPFGYFSDKALRSVLLPTLLACCHDNAANRCVLQKEMSYQMLDDFVNSDDGRSLHLVQTVLQKCDE